MSCTNVLYDKPLTGSFKKISLGFI